MEAVQAVLSASNAWLQGPNGRSFMAHLMQLGMAQPRSDDEYLLDSEVVPNDSVKLVYGYIIRGEAITPSRVDVVKRRLMECDLCNTNTICAREVKNGEGRYLFACANCIRQSPDLTMKYSSDSCTACTYQRCVNKGR